MRSGVSGRVEGLRASEGDSLVVQHGSVWSMRILDMFPPVCVRVCACACWDLRGQSGLFVGLRALLCATGASRTSRAFRLDPPFPVLKDRIYCDNSFRSITDRPALNAALLLLFPRPESSTSTRVVLHRWNGCEGSRMKGIEWRLLSILYRHPLPPVANLEFMSPVTYRDALYYVWNMRISSAAWSCDDEWTIWYVSWHEFIALKSHPVPAKSSLDFISGTK